MRCYCIKCGKEKRGVRPRDLKRRGHTADTYVCLECARSNRHPRHCGPQETLNQLKYWGETYKHIHSGCFAGRD